MIKDRVILVTGGNGFLGQYVCKELEQRGAHRVIVPRSSKYNLVNLNGCQNMFVEHDDIEIVIHLAARVGGIGANQKNPAKYLHDNAVMGLNVLNEAYNRGIKKLIMLGTCCSYPKMCPVPFREENLHRGYPEETNAPYGLAKKLLLEACIQYRRQYGFNAIGLIPANLYGPGDNFDPETSHVIPALIRRLWEAKQANAERIWCWGSGNVSREFLHARDAAEAICEATEKYSGEDLINLGTNAETPIYFVAKRIAELVGYTGEICWDHTKPDGQPRRCLETSRAKYCFGWQAKTSLNEGLKETVEWYIEQVAAGTPATAS